MQKLPDTPCRKCGGETTLQYIPSSGMDIGQIGLKRTCERCGFSEFIESLDEQKIKEASEGLNNK